MIFLAIIVGILIILFLITLHEFGHFLVAKLFKVYIYEFSIGIGPKIISWKGKETRYSIRLFPFGGYVYSASEYLDPPKDQEDVIIPNHRYMEGINRFKRLCIIFAGVFMNFVIAITLFTSIFTIAGYSANDVNGYGATYYTKKDSPASILGLDNNDQKNPEIITDVLFFYSEGSERSVKWDPSFAKKYTDLSINSNKDLRDFYDSAMLLQKDLKLTKTVNAPNTIFVKYGIYNHLTHKIDKITGWSSYGYCYGDQKSKYVIKDHYIIGMTAPNYYFANSTDAYVYGWKKMFSESVSILKAFGKLFTGQWSQLVGPVGTIEQTKSFVSSGAEPFFLYVATLSANLFILNLIPIPPLDGFKFMITFIEMCIRREINGRLKFFITIVGAVFFLILFVGLTIKDIFF